MIKSKSKMHIQLPWRCVVLLISFCAVVNGVCAENTLTIPKDTILSIVMQSDVCSDPLSSPEAFSAATCEDLMVDGHVAWPKGSKIAGRIIRNEFPVRHMDRSVGMRLVFNSIQTPQSGAQKPLKVCLVAHGGVINFWRGTDKIQVDTLTEMSCGGLLGPSTAPISTTASKESKPQLLYGVERKDIYRSSIVLVKKGRIIDIKAGDITKIRLLEDFRFNE
ncbi:MAG: hypothetical protein P4L53_20900 [Candidatus Obscuribacterales bacterium]|nr:hypothetical protein [Candidatus Obscuribacterales bacterium]